MSEPLAVDLFCGLGGWTEGLLAEGYTVVGFDCERHAYGDAKYPAQLVLQDVLTIHGAQFKDAALIVASPPCQEFSYMAMPWTRAKEKATALRDGRDDPKRLTALFDACFRIQREAIEAAGHFIPLVVENVCGAQKWVGRARWHFGSFYLWGDVPALMPITRRANKGHGGAWFKDADTADGKYGPGNFRNGVDGRPTEADSILTGEGLALMECAGEIGGTKNDGGSWFNVAHNTTSGHGQNPVKRISEAHRSKDPKKGYGAVNQDGIKQGGDWFNNSEPSISRQTGSKSNARKAASAHIAKIPLVLARHIAKAWYPTEPGSRVSFGASADRGR